MNPYEVLGVPETATDEQIRQAYLNLVKRYHPDQYVNNPLSSLAQEKLKAINEAYDIITKQRQKNSRSGGYNTRTGSGGSTYNGGYQGYDASTGGSQSEVFARVRQLLGANQPQAAYSLLMNMQARPAEWYYLAGVACMRMGDMAQAEEMLNRACTMEPNNAEYRNMRDRMSSVSSRFGYPNQSGRYGRTSSTSSLCDVCQCLICTDCCCECMGGDFISCC